MKNKGQTALIVILLAAAALIFYAVTLNWGRVAQVKTLVTVAADQAAASLGSSIASLGEVQKVQYCHNRNQRKEFNLTVLLESIVLAIFIVIAIVLSVYTGGATGFLATFLMSLLVTAIAGAAAAAVTLTLYLAAVLPIQDDMWNKLMQNQPLPERLLEPALGMALQGSVTDQVNISDYFDSNGNGLFGTDQDKIGRFSFFYGERMKMLNGTIPDVGPQVAAFVSGMNALKGQLSDTPCADAGNPYCNSCCQPYFEPLPQNFVSLNITPYTYVHVPQQGCPDFSNQSSCPDGTPNQGEQYPAGCEPCLCSSQTGPSPGTNCDPYNAQCAPAKADQNPNPGLCSVGNPYNLYGTYPFLYDPLYQNAYPTYPNPMDMPTSTMLPPKSSVLEQLGRDLQMTTGGNPLSLTPANAATPYSPVAPLSQVQMGGAKFPPNGIYPFLWYSKYNHDNLPKTDITNNTYSTDAEGSYQDSIPGGQTDVLQWDGTNGIPGDNEMCSLNYPYNSKDPKTACNAKPDPPDLTWQTLERFVGFATVFSQSGFSASNLTTWWPSAAAWIAPLCTDASAFPRACNTVDQGEGKLLTIYNPYIADANKGIPATDLMLSWETEIANWLQNSFTSANASAWCFPAKGSGNVVVSQSSEDGYISNCGGINNAANINCVNAQPPYDQALKAAYPPFQTQPQDLGGVLACLDYNGNAAGDATNSAAAGFQACYKELLADGGNGACPADLSTTTNCKTIGRSLVANQPTAPAWDKNCAANGGYMTWLNNSTTAATAAAPEFADRAAFLKNLYNEAAIMLQVFAKTDTDLQNFLGIPGPPPTNLTNAPAYQLMQAEDSLVKGSQNLPNSVIYGWQDPIPGSGFGCGKGGQKMGCGHIVRVTAYSAGRPPKGTYKCVNGPGGWCPYTCDEDASTGNSQCIALKLPWVHAHHEYDDNTDYYDLLDRDGWVFVKVTRWDQPHTSSTLFPNNLPLWNFTVQNPVSSNTKGFSWFPSGCNNDMKSLTLGNSIAGFGLAKQTVDGLTHYAKFTGNKMLDVDQEALNQAFMLNDVGDGSFDPFASDGIYNDCKASVNALLDTGITSEACVAYVGASPSAVDPTTLKSHLSEDASTANYTLLFVQCPKDLPDDLLS